MQWVRNLRAATVALEENLPLVFLLLRREMGGAFRCRQNWLSSKIEGAGHALRLGADGSDLW